tara:strand:+ start:53 stop:445 length:393 start_codon:yes stop_codon:yes gene_type:complete
MIYKNVTNLLANTEGYRVQDISWFREYISTPIELGQYFTNEECTYFCTYAFPNEEQIKSYLENWYIDSDVFYENGNNIWLIDFIAQDNYRNLMQSFREIKNVLSSLGYTQCYWLRDRNGKLGFHRLVNYG